MSDLPIVVSMNPMLYTDRSGQKWAVSGQHWVEVPDTLTLAEIGKYMIVEHRETPAQAADVRSYEVQGSNGNTYTVTENGGRGPVRVPVSARDGSASMWRLGRMQVGDLVIVTHGSGSSIVGVIATITHDLGRALIRLHTGEHFGIERLELSTQIGDLVRVKRKAMQPDLIGLIAEFREIGGNRGTIVKPVTDQLSFLKVHDASRHGGDQCK